MKNDTYCMWIFKPFINNFTQMKDEVLIQFGLRIRKLRKERNWSQEELAENTGFHRTYIGMIERGERNPSLVNINAFAHTFGLTLSELFHL